MCGGGSKPKPKPRPKPIPQPPAQPPAVKATAAEVNIGSKTDSGPTKRRKVGRSQLRQNKSSGGSRTSGLGS